MKIIDISCIPIKLQMKEPFVIANVTNYDMYYVIVKVVTDEGIIGYGEATPAWEVTGETYQSVMACVELFRDGSLLGYTLIGKEIGSLNSIKEIMDTIEPKSSIRLVYGNPSAIAAVEQAILDACGKFLHQPIYHLFGADNQLIQYTRNISILDVDSTLERVSIGINQGYKIIRLKVGLKGGGGLPGYERDVQVVRQSRELIKQSGISLLLIADANQGFRDVATTIEFCRQVEGNLDWLEQPTIAENLMAFSKIRQSTSVPLMVDEALHSYEQARMLLELGGVDYFNIKLMKTGGLLRAIDIIDLAADYGVKCQIGSMLESSLGASMGCHTALVRPQVISTDLNSFDLLKENFAGGITLQPPYLQLSSDEGCGMKFDEQVLSHYSIND